MRRKQALDDRAPDHAMLIYQGMMHEVKVRLEAALAMIGKFGGAETSGGDFITAEFCFLQTRMICEIMALSSLVVHEPHLESKRLLKQYAADGIFKGLWSVNNDSFPRAIIQKTISPTRHHFDFHDPQPFTARDLKQCYTSCGNVLHRGQAEKLLAGEIRNYDIVAVQEWLTAIKSLLETHLILLNGKEAVVVMMNGNDAGDVVVLRGVAESNPPFEKPD